VSASALRAIEQDEVEPSLQVLARIGAALGSPLGVRFFPGTGPLVRDHLQAAMIEALLAMLHGRWHPRLEVPVHRPVRVFIDVVLEAVREPIIACEAHSDLLRIEQQLRWSLAKAEALVATHPAIVAPARHVGRLLLMRSSQHTRAVVAAHGQIIATAYPARARDAFAALQGDAPWPGDAILWCRLEGGHAIILEHPPRGIAVGR
jgi:transcriptional regulator with XRE-family HTH domain